MEQVEAWSVLGLRPGAEWDEVRSSYRRLIRAAHPDLVGSGGARRAAQLNDAYTTLVRARRQGRLSPVPPSSPPGAPPRSRPRTGPPPGRPTGPVEVLEGDTVFLPVPVDEAFVLVANACHRIGEVTYVDRSAPILETVLPLEGIGACSLVVTFQGRAHGTEAFCTLEALQRVAQPPVHHVVAALVDALQG
jgi:hypothetical protein